LPGLEILAANSPHRAGPWSRPSGHNAIWNEWFKGLIDEVRLYDRALTASQVQADLNTAVSSTVLGAVPPIRSGLVEVAIEPV
jgi:hypothetical protein